MPKGGFRFAEHRELEESRETRLHSYGGREARRKISTFRNPVPFYRM